MGCSLKPGMGVRLSSLEFPSVWGTFFHTDEMSAFMSLYPVDGYRLSWACDQGNRMSIHFQCECGKQLTAKDEHAGKRARCSTCKRILVVPEQQNTDDSPISGHWSAAPSLSAVAAQQQTRVSPAHESRTARDYTYLLLLLALVPLAVSMLRRDDVGLRLEQTLKETPAVGDRLLEAVKEKTGQDHIPGWFARFLPDEFYGLFPDNRIHGALLGRSSGTHWLLAMLAFAAFFGLILLFFPRGIANARDLLLVALFTATAGMMILLGLQALANATRGYVVIRGGIPGLIFLIFKFICGSYDAALDPRANFFVSFIGFTFAVGFLEESCKAIPLVWHYRARGTLTWRGACLWGLASGVGFGVAEGISYCSNFYNGIDTGGIYLVRFISCVAIHSIWAASVGIFIHQQRKILANVSHVVGFVNFTFGVVVAAMFLHGLYDTLLKKDHDLLALLTAVASFVLLATQIEYMRKQEVGRRAGRAWAGAA